MNAEMPAMTKGTTPTDDDSQPQDCVSTGRPFRLDVDEVLTKVGFGFCRHIRNKTSPDESELLDWWHQILNTQVVIGALVEECERALDDGLSEDARLILANAVFRIGGGTRC